MGSSGQPYEVSHYAKKVNEYRYLSLEEELDLARRYRKGDSLAGQDLVKANLRHVVKAGRPFFKGGHSPMEIIQEGNMGLLRALPMFNPDRGVKFFSYAVWWVRCYIMNFIARSRKPRTGMLGHAPKIVSLDVVVSDTSGTEECFVSNVPDESPNQEEKLISRQEPMILLGILDSDACPLTSRERYVLKRRYLDEPRPTLGDVALTLNVTKERVRQIENKSLEKMKEHIQARYSFRNEGFAARDHAGGRGGFLRSASAN